jgi:hypothetical protein
MSTFSHQEHGLHPAMPQPDVNNAAHHGCVSQEESDEKTQEPHFSSIQDQVGSENSTKHSDTKSAMGLRRRSDGCLLSMHRHTADDGEEAPAFLTRWKSEASVSEFSRSAKSLPATKSVDSDEDIPPPKQRSIFSKIKRLFKRKSASYIDLTRISHHLEEGHYFCQASRIRLASEGMDESIIDMF